MSKSIFEEYNGRWCVVDAGSCKFIGRAIESDQNDFFGTPQITLQPFFEYVNQKVPQQNGALSKMEIALPYENITASDASIELVNIISVMWFDKMNKSDRSTYERVIDKAAQILENLRAERAGFVTARTMPKEQGGKIIL